MGQSASTPAATAAPSIPAVSPSTSSQSRAKCPVDHSTMKKKADTEAAQCPVQHDVNPLNQMPELQQNPISSNQSTSLPTERVVSTIPRDQRAKWEYPSPQQFYNALVRKGWETPENHVETMVEIHNFLNEEAWGEVVRWEERVNGARDLQLARFQGKPGQFSPKARFFMLAGRVFPSRFSSDPPFDRHDWIVRRGITGEEVRYVIDYYSLPDDHHGNPVFSLDVRPALDSFGSIKERVSVAVEDTWANFRQSQSQNRYENNSTDHSKR